MLFSIGRPLTPAQVLDCSPGAPKPEPAPYSANVTYVHHAASPEGPWTVLDAGGTLQGFTNPAPHIFPNESVVVTRPRRRAGKGRTPSIGSGW